MTTPIDKPSVLLIVGGGIAAYKSLELIRLLRGAGIGVRTVLTKAGAQFVTPLSLASLSGEKVYDDLFSLTDETEMGHIELSRQADLIVIAPATADLLAKAAHGLANDLASTLLLASDKPALAAPAMNWRMWEHPATRRNCAQLRADGMKFIGPNQGAMACGQWGFGRMCEPEEIFAAIQTCLKGESVAGGALAGKRIVITAGPTHEPIDPVRYIANRSSGKQGYAIARAARAAGAEVSVVSGPVTLPAPEGVRVIPVETALEMASAVDAALPCDIFIAAAAVCDYRPVVREEHKIKKSEGKITIEFERTTDILLSMSKRRRRQMLVGFCLETDNLETRAREKLQVKRIDLVVANGPEAIDADRQDALIISSSGRIEHFNDVTKEDLAKHILAAVSKHGR
jgi:phosphopantothenoylcysteine decarboxylase/phosphopantothenate--cysteine ligase